MSVTVYESAHAVVTFDSEMRLPGIISKRSQIETPAPEPKPKPKRARSIRGSARAFHRLGFSDSAIAKALNSRGYRQASGKRHTSKSVREARE